MNVLRGVAKFYNQCAKEYGDSLMSVNWSSRENQALRFAQFLPFLPDRPFHLNDVGCGVGDLLPYVQQYQAQPFHYAGYDISHEMVAVAQDKFSADPKASFHTVRSLAEMQTADVSIASGTFNRRLLFPSKRKHIQYFQAGISAMAKASTVGFGFNFLSDKQKPRWYDGLLYLNPEDVLAFGKRAFGMNYEVLDSYHEIDVTMWWYR